MSLSGVNYCSFSSVEFCREVEAVVISLGQTGSADEVVKGVKKHFNNQRIRYGLSQPEGQEKRRRLNENRTALKRMKTVSTLSVRQPSSLISSAQVWYAMQVKHDQSPLMQCRERDLFDAAIKSWSCTLEMKGHKDHGLGSVTEVGFDEFLLYEELYFDGPPSTEAWLVQDAAWWSESVSILQVSILQVSGWLRPFKFRLAFWVLFEWSQRPDEPTRGFQRTPLFHLPAEKWRSSRVDCLPQLIAKDRDGAPRLDLSNSGRLQWICPWMVNTALLNDHSVATWVSQLYPDPATAELSSSLPPLASLLQDAEHASLRLRVNQHLAERVVPTADQLQHLWRLRQNGRDDDYEAARIALRSRDTD